MFETVQKTIADKMDIDAATITMETTFESLEVDSLDMVEIIMDLEEAFGVTIEKNDDLKSVADLVAYVETLKA